MLTLPSSRKFVYPALILLAVVTVSRLLIGLSGILPSIHSNGLRLRSSSKTTYNVQLEPWFNQDLTLEEQFTTNYHASHPIQPVHPYVLDLLSRCNHKPNPHTNHIRLASVRILNISIVPSANGEATTEFKGNQYFNPALIPLPSYSPHSYLLISRLVTSGSHQESHVCFADICSPPSTTPLQPDTRACTDDDIEFLGENGGMRCVTGPGRVNIPPTPARRCTGAWRTFPDIPGFHDPRVFWSGRGEPLIEVNSGSSYGCVGLWIQDLRAIYPALDDVLLRKRRVKREEEEDKGAAKRKTEGMDLIGLGVKMGYPSLTELTRNPRRSRNEVEKNWVLFFPREREAWVQYDVMGRVVEGDEGSDEVVWVQSASISEVAEVVSTSSAASEDATAIVEDLVHELSLQGRAEDAGPGPDVEGSNQIVASVHGSPAPNLVALERLSLAALDATSLSPPSATMTTPPSFANTIATSAISTSRSHASPAVQSPQLPFRGGRTIAQLLSHGFTTPNLTSPSEPSCFNVTDYSHEHDALNNTGHWHQGSNSLRLILCTREQFRTRSCLSIVSRSKPQQDHRSVSHDEYENILIDQGLLVHFSIIHRKFSNPWKLPLRYERYFLMWEARRPFRTLGVSSWPVLFEDERARPWGREEDAKWGALRDTPSTATKRSINGIVARDIDAEVEADLNKGGHASTYFTYTPSIAWSWRGKSEGQATHQQRGHEDLGTGYVGDEIVVGIGMDDVAQGFAKIKVDDMLGCMRLCPGVAGGNKEA